MIYINPISRGGRGGIPPIVMNIWITQITQTSLLFLNIYYTTFKPILSFQTFWGEPVAPPGKLGVSLENLMQVWSQTHLQCTTEKFKSDDEVQISADDNNIDATKEVDIFFNENICKMFCSVTCSEGWYWVLRCNSCLRGW